MSAVLDQFVAQRHPLAWVNTLRENAFARFSKLGFPTTHDEEYRFTNVAPIARAEFRVEASNITISSPVAVDELRPDELTLLEQNAFVALNTAFLDRVTVIRVPRGVVLDQPIEITYESPGPGTASHPRTLIVIGANAQCTIVETYRHPNPQPPAPGPYFTNAVTEIVAGEGAVVDHYKLQQEDLSAYHVAALHVTLGRSTNFTTHSISLGGALVRNDASAVLSEGTEATLNGLYIVNGTQHIDNHTAIDHAKPHGTSHELYKGILDGKASAVFNGRIIVRKDAQKTDSKQTNKNLVLSDDAVIDTKPELQILADDVRCTHGATIGQLDAESLFYLRSRGIGKDEARSLLTYAFAQDIVDRIKIASLRDSLERILFEKFHEHYQ